ncbi:ABC transporter ATP-binding protein [Terrihabitans sp. B22-R8]|uniref:ABC transporter ATP-binding protein n=1 Tax=Terrihabitans sp. B22-R8 TaxID=3425128 RepID=UPI00403D3875
MTLPALKLVANEPHSAPAGPLVFEARGLTLDYETSAGITRAVDHVDLTIAEGERLVLLGPSGCGKSSILKAAAGFLHPASGELLVRGRPVTGPGPDRIVVFQEFDQLLPWKTIIDNVAFPLRVARGVSRRDARERAREALMRVGLSRALDHYPHTLSGGMKQRAAIARALAAEPDILLMDEPFAALDALTRLQMQEDLLKLAKELGITLLFVTHAIDEAVLIGTRLHLLSAHPGRTIATFDTSDLDASDVGTPPFDRVVREVHDLLFGAGKEPHR